MDRSFITFSTCPCSQTERRPQGNIHWRLVGLLLPLLLTLNRPVSAVAAWPTEFVAGPFQCHADYELRDQISITKELQNLHSDLRRTLALGAPRRPIHVYLFRQKSTYRRYVQHFFPAAPRRQALFVTRNGVSMVFVQRQPELETDLRHECTHAILHATLPQVPLWLDEGLAEYFEVVAEDRVEKSPYLKQVRSRVQRGKATQLEPLENLDEHAQMSASQYRDAWSWTHFLLHSSRDSHRELNNYLAASAAKRQTESLSERLSRQIPQWKRQYRSHFLK